MRYRPVALALLGIALLAARPSRAAEVVTLEGPPRVDGLRLADANGDGVGDVLLLHERELWYFPGVAQGFPAAKATRRFPLPPDVGYVAIGNAQSPGGPGLLVLGPEGLRHVNLEDERMEALDAGPGLPAWTDARGAAFVDAVREDGTLLLPTSDGFRLIRTGAEDLQRTDLAVAPSRALEPAGPFLEDTWRVVVGHRWPVFVAAADDAGEAGVETVWALAGDGVLAFRGDARHARDLLRVPPGGQRRLLALDQENPPVLYHVEATNRFGVYGFYRLPTLETGADAPDAWDLGAPTTRLRLEGSQIQPTHVDLDDDGRRDFVVTVIPIDARNTARAIQGKVTAYTMAYLNRGDDLYAASPDASVASDVGVAIRFSQAGTIDVRRSFTILPDADVNGDGRKDLVIREDAETLVIHPGARSGVWEKEPLRLAIPPMDGSPNVEGYRGDLDGEAGDEIVLLYRAPFEGEDRVRILKP